MHNSVKFSLSRTLPARDDRHACSTSEAEGGHCQATEGSTQSQARPSPLHKPNHGRKYNSSSIEGLGRSPQAYRWIYQVDLGILSRRLRQSKVTLAKKMLILKSGFREHDNWATQLRQKISLFPFLASCLTISVPASIIVLDISKSQAPNRARRIAKEPCRFGCFSLRQLESRVRLLKSAISFPHFTVWLHSHESFSGNPFVQHCLS